MPDPREPALSPCEEWAWRALTDVANHLVKILGSVSEYVVLVHFSEADGQRLRIGDLAPISAPSPSRVSRLGEEMAVIGTATKTRTTDDSRCTLATLTPSGLETLKATHPTQLRDVGRRVFDPLTDEDVKRSASYSGGSVMARAIESCIACLASYLDRSVVALVR
ncbi:MAG: winged helix-turn-helix transcriptional regulator [Acidobacteria bacterium]|nr:winged helix-turn-helix transcriptional regulator [Acidobacteriota bacterium]